MRTWRRKIMNVHNNIKDRIYYFLDKIIWKLGNLAKALADRRLYFLRFLCVILARIVVKLQEPFDPIPKELLNYMVSEIMRIGEYE